MKSLLTFLLTTTALAQTQIATLRDFKKSNLPTDLSQWFDSRLVLNTATSGTSGWFYFPKAVSLVGQDSVVISVVVAEGSKDAGLDISNRLDPNAKNGAWDETTFFRLMNTFGNASGNLYFMRRNGGERTGKFLSPFPTGAHTLKLVITKTEIVALLLSNGIWRSLNRESNTLPDSFYVSTTASWKWVLADLQILSYKKVIAPPEPRIIYNEKVLMAWGRHVEPKVKYRVHLGLASRSYPMRWVTSDTFFVFTNLDTGRTYFAAVTAIDSAGNESIYSDEVSFVRRDTTRADPLDLTGDKRVNLADYTLLKANLGKPGKGDFDVSGKVDELDLLWYWRFGKFTES